jgi:hypothetical protein
MSKNNTSKNTGNTSKVFKRKSISNRNYTMLMTVSLALVVAMCMLSLHAYVNMARAQTSAADKSGTIASTQEDQAGTWKLSGTWNSNNLNSNSPTFTSTFSMAKEDGSAMHKHTINDFKLTGNPATTSTGTTYDGTATVSMKDGPVSNVPVSITMSDNGNFSIMVDPKATKDHFGSTPIEGKVTA